MTMQNVVFVYVDKPRIDAFIELLTEDGYTKVTGVSDLGVEQYFLINTKEKFFSYAYLLNRKSANR